MYLVLARSTGFTRHDDESPASLTPHLRVLALLCALLGRGVLAVCPGLAVSVLAGVDEANVVPTATGRAQPLPRHMGKKGKAFVLLNREMEAMRIAQHRSVVDAASIIKLYIVPVYSIKYIVYST